MIQYVDKHSLAGKAILAIKRGTPLRTSDLPLLRRAAAEGELVTVDLSSPLGSPRHIVLETRVDIEAFFNFIGRYAV